MTTKPGDDRELDPVLATSVGRIWKQRIRLKRLQRIRDVLSGKHARLEVEGCKHWETDAFCTDQSRYFLFLSKRGNRPQYVRRERVELVGEPVYLGRGDSNALLAQMSSIRSSIAHARESGRLYHQPLWFGRVMAQITHDEVLYREMQRRWFKFQKNQRDRNGERQRRIRKWFRAFRLHRCGKGPDPGPRPRSRSPVVWGKQPRQKSNIPTYEEKEK